MLGITIDLDISAVVLRIDVVLMLGEDTALFTGVATPD